MTHSTSFEKPIYYFLFPTFNRLIQHTAVIISSGTLNQKKILSLHMLSSNSTTTTIATIETTMSEPRKKKKYNRASAFVVTLVLGLTGFGYYLDPEGELARELLQNATGIRINTYTSKNVQVPLSETPKHNDSVGASKNVGEDDEAAKRLKYAELRIAVRMNEAEQIKSILKKYPEFGHRKSANGWLLLHEAAKHGLTESVRALVEVGNININTRAEDDGKLGALDIARRSLQDHNHPTVVYLKENGAVFFDPLLVDLKIATYANDIHGVENILKTRPDLVTQADENGRVVLHDASIAGLVNIVQVLVEQGKADVNARTGLKGDGDSVLALAKTYLKDDANPVLSYLISVGAKDIVKESQPREDNVSQPREDNLDSIDSTHSLENINSLAQILEANPDFVEIKDENGFSILHEAAAFGKLDIVKYIIENTGADINARVGMDHDGPNALFLAKSFLSEDHQVIQYLVSMGAEALDEDKLVFTDGTTYLPSALLDATLQNDHETMLHIFKHRPEWVDRRDNNGWSALHEASRAGQVDTVKLLVEVGNADVNARTSPSSDGGSVLYHAMRQLGSEHPTVQYLREAGAKHIAPGDEKDL